MRPWLLVLILGAVGCSVSAAELGDHSADRVESTQPIIRTSDTTGPQSIIRDSDPTEQVPVNTNLCCYFMHSCCVNFFRSPPVYSKVPEAKESRREVERKKRRNTGSSPYYK